MEEIYKEDKKAACVVTLKARGPVVISGDFIVIDEEGNELAKQERISLCRCSASKTYPICDGAHKCLSF